MTCSVDDLTAHLLARLRRVQQDLGVEPSAPDDPGLRFADALDSMGMAEFLALLADDCGVTPAAIEECTGRQFGTVAALACAMHAAGVLPRPVQSALVGRGDPPPLAGCWLAATAVRLPEMVQPAVTINQALGRPAGWLESHAGIVSRRIWAGQDPLAAAADAGRAAVAQAGLPIDAVGALLVTSEAPPLLAGLAAALHHRLGLRPDAVALEVGGACTGFLAALWTAQRLLPQAGTVLVLAVEAHSHHLPVKPGSAGEAAALFGDAAAAAVLCAGPTVDGSVRVAEVVLGADGSIGHLLRPERSSCGVELHMDGTALAARAVRAMAKAVHELAWRHGLTPADLAAVIAHGGNGRMPALLARQLGLPPERVWSETAHTGNLGSATLPAAWAARQPAPPGPAVWTAVGAGLTWGAAIMRRGAVN